MTARRWHRPRLPVVVVFALLAAGCAGEGVGERAPIPVPRDFVGVVAPDVLTATPAARARALAGMRRTGVGVIRQFFDWRRIEPRPGRYRWGLTDAWVLACARAGLDVLPIVFNTPAWAAAPAAPGTTPVPRRPRHLARFALVLIRRYGPRGGLWRRHPGVSPHPIRAWQVWNEPNLPQFWGGRPAARAYVRLLRAVGGTIRAAEPGATVVAAGLPNSRLGVPFLRYLERMYAAGARGTFDALGLHPYSPKPAGVLAAVRQARALLDRNGDAPAEIWVTELGWADRGPASPFTVGRARQAAYLSAALRELAAARLRLGLRGMVYYDWRDAKPLSGQADFFGLHTGLETVNGLPKPAYRSFTSTLRALHR